MAVRSTKSTIVTRITDTLHNPSDGDYKHLCVTLRKMGAHVVLVANQDYCSKALRESVSEFVSYKDLLEENSKIREPTSEAMMLRQISRGSSNGSTVSKGSLPERVNYVVSYAGRFLMQDTLEDMSSEIITEPIGELDEVKLLRQISRNTSSGSDVILPGSLPERIEDLVSFAGKCLMQRAYSGDVLCEGGGYCLL